jgi:pentatricopeptide repeat protein
VWVAKLQVWDDAVTDGCEPDCRMATTLVEVCARAGDTDRALATYDTMAVGALC